MFGIIGNCMLFSVSLRFLHLVDSDIFCKTPPIILIFDCHFPVKSFFLLSESKNGRSHNLPSIHFIFRSLFILSSCQNRHRTHLFGHFLFYRPVRTVTGLINDEEELIKFLIILYSLLFRNTIPIFILFTPKR